MIENVRTESARPSPCEPNKRALTTLFLVAILALSGCGNLAERSFRPVVIDDAGLLSPEVKIWLENISFPRGYALVVRTVDELPGALIGAKADDLFDQSIEAYGEKKAMKRRGVFLLASRSPSLVQVRVGSEIYSVARWGGVTAGPEYIRLQTMVGNKDLGSALQEVVPWLAESLPRAMSLPPFKRVILQQTQEILGDEIEEMGLPSESFYGHFLLKPILRLRVTENRLFKSWWITYAFVALVVFLLQYLIGAILASIRGRLIEKGAGSRHVIDLLRVLLNIGVAIVALVPSAAGAIFISGSRLEDQIALSYSGIKGVERIAFEADSYKVGTGLSIALLILLLRLVKGFGSRSNLLCLARLSGEEQRDIFSNMEEESPVNAFIIQSLGAQPGTLFEIAPDDFMKSPFSNAYFMPGIHDAKAAVAWSALAYFFLPKPLSLSLVFLWAFPAIGGVMSTVKATMKQPNRAPSSKHAPRFLAAAIMLSLVIIFGISATQIGLDESVSDLSEIGPLTTESKLTLRGIGPVRIGMTVEEARVALGGLRGEVAGNETNSVDCYSVSPLKGPAGISFMVVDGHIVRADVANSLFGTLSGAHVGDRESHVLELYHGRLDVSPHMYDEKGHYLTFLPHDKADKDYRMIFETDGKTVTTFRAGKIPEVELVEGCL